jgi:hypothetical protein
MTKDTDTGETRLSKKEKREEDLIFVVKLSVFMLNVMAPQNSLLFSTDKFEFICYRISKPFWFVFSCQKPIEQHILDTYAGKQLS